MSTSISPIHFHFSSGPFYFPQRTRLKAFLVKQFAREGQGQLDTVNYIFCSDDYLLQINRQYLNHDTYTDIITFPLSPAGEPLVSDIYISVERVRANARSFQTTFARELHRVIFHGALHLCGYKDKTPKEEQAMRAAEERWLQAYFGK